MISFSPFWEMLAERKISVYDLEYKYNLNPAEISRLKHNHNFTIKTLAHYCSIFQCRIEDIIIYVEENEDDAICNNSLHIRNDKKSED